MFVVRKQHVGELSGRQDGCIALGGASLAASFTKFFLVLATDVPYGLIQSEPPLHRARALRMSVKSLQGESAGLPVREGVHRLIVALCWELWKGSHERFRQLFSR